MYKSILRAAGVLIAPALFMAAPAGAAPIFSTADTVAVQDAPGAPSIFSSSVIFGLTDSSVISFDTALSSNQNAAAPGDTVTVGSIAYTPSAIPGSATFDENFEYKVILTDTASAATGEVDLSGEWLGNETSNPNSITSSFKNVTLSTNSLTLNGTKYLISVGTLAGPSGNSNGVLQLNVTVPEPASLSILSLSALCMFRRRR